MYKRIGLSFNDRPIFNVGVDSICRFESVLGIYKPVKVFAPDIVKRLFFPY